ncbi:MAG: spore maturation protein [Clostridia bacterium]|nr:spore maturation protein [Clostridia bacterium]
MNIINYISTLAMPLIIAIIIIWGIIEKKPIFDLFLDGAKEGLQVTLKIFPTLIGIFFAIGLLRSSGVIDFCTNLISPITSLLNIPSEIMPLALLRPISGSASIGVATDIMTKFGVDSYIGRVASVIMGSTETTFYTIAVYTSCVRIKKNRGVLAASLTADLMGILSAVIICRILS